MSRVRGGVEPRYWKGVPTKLEETSREAARRAVVLAIVLVAGLLSGCGATRPSKYYQLTVPTDPPAVEKVDAVPVSLLLGGLMTSHLYREDRIVYGNGSEQLGTYEYQRWAEPPAEMIQEILLRELRASGRYRAVHYRRSNMQGDFALRGHLYDFKEVTGPQMSARVTLDLEMRDLKSGATMLRAGARAALCRPPARLPGRGKDAHSQAAHEKNHVVPVAEAIYAPYFPQSPRNPWKCVVPPPVS